MSSVNCRMNKAAREKIRRYIITQDFVTSLQRTGTYTDVLCGRKLRVCYFNSSAQSKHNLVE